MRRREFITLLGVTAFGLPRLVRAQQTDKPIIAYVSARSPSSDAQLVSAFRAGLNSAGYIEDRNVTVEFQWAEGQYDRLPAMMANAVAKRPALILAAGSPAGLAARAATSTVPILFNSGTDPVAIGLVNSLGRPDGNMTGVVTLVGDLAEKDLGLLHQLLPRARKIAILINPNSRPVARHLAEVDAAAGSIGLQVVNFQARTAPEIETAFASMAQQQVEALLVIADPFLFTAAPQLVALAARHALPAMYFRREFADAGGLMSYGSVASEPYRQLGVYAGRILKGEKPADLPVVQATKFELVINLKAAKALGIDVPNSMQLLADEVIE